MSESCLHPVGGSPGNRGSQGEDHLLVRFEKAARFGAAAFFFDWIAAAVSTIIC